MGYTAAGHLFQLFSIPCHSNGTLIPLSQSMDVTNPAEALTVVSLAVCVGVVLHAHSDDHYYKRQSYRHPLGPQKAGTQVMCEGGVVFKHINLSAESHLQAEGRLAELEKLYKCLKFERRAEHVVELRNEMEYGDSCTTVTIKTSPVGMFLPKFCAACTCPAATLVPTVLLGSMLPDSPIVVRCNNRCAAITTCA